MSAAQTVPVIFLFIGMSILTMDLWSSLPVRAIGYLTRKRDRGYLIYETILDLLENRTDQWVFDRFTARFGTTQIAIWIANEDYALRLTTTDGEMVHRSENSLVPSRYWRRRIWVAVKRIQDDAKKAQKINYVCDQIESLASQNVLPFRVRK